MNKKNIKNITLVVLLLAGLFVAYSFFTGDSSDGELLSSSSASELTVVDNLFVLLNSLSQLRIDTSIFEKESYRSLKDYTVILGTEPQGRTNPFRPIQ
ncbi:MAG: hypothetical protein WD003_00330 [Candidatus Paceibacterota bacterium]